MYAEVERIKKLIGNSTTAVVMDQFRATGGTLAHATDLLHQAGITSPIAIGGIWYQDIGDEPQFDYDPEGLTSYFASQMKQIGHQCYELFVKNEVI